MKNNCSILVLSCDKNIGLLNIFFERFFLYWPDCPFDIYLGMEDANVKYQGVITLNSRTSGWAARVQEYLRKISQEFLMIILDDFVLERQADTSKIKKFVDFISKNKDIANISFAEIQDKNNIDANCLDLLQRRNNANYLLNMQVGVWRKDILLQLLRPNETPWQTELYGSIRARVLKKYRFFCLKCDDDSPYKYGRGWLIVQGAWNGNEIKRLKLEKYYNDIFDGKDILYSGFASIELKKRIIRRLNILIRQMLSWINVYI